MKRKVLAYIINFFVVGSGFVLYKQTWIGFCYLILYVILWSFHAEIGAIWALLIMIVSYIHLYKVIKNSGYHNGE